MPHGIKERKGSGIFFSHRPPASQEMTLVKRHVTSLRDILAALLLDENPKRPLYGSRPTHRLSAFATFAFSVERDACWAPCCPSLSNFSPGCATETGAALFARLASRAG